MSIALTLLPFLIFPVGPAVFFFAVRRLDRRAGRRYLAELAEHRIRQRLSLLAAVRQLDGEDYELMQRQLDVLKPLARPVGSTQPPDLSTSFTDANQDPDLGSYDIR